jgi:hypothetical protein
LPAKDAKGHESEVAFSFRVFGVFRGLHNAKTATAARNELPRRRNVLPIGFADSDKRSTIMRKDILRILSVSLLAAGMVAAQAQIQRTNPAAGAPMTPAQGGTAAVAPATTAPAGPILGEPAAAKPVQEAPPAKPKPKKPGKPTYRGKLSAVDKTALTLTVNVKDKARTFQITSETRFTKDGKPATMGDGVVDGEVTVVAKPAKKGKLQVAESVRFGGKAATAKSPQKTRQTAGKKTAAKDTPK